MENRLKELHHGLEMNRTSCSLFLANQFRVLLTLAAYLLFQELHAGPSRVPATRSRSRSLSLRSGGRGDRGNERCHLHGFGRAGARALTGRSSPPPTRRATRAGTCSAGSRYKTSPEEA